MKKPTNSKYSDDQVEFLSLNVNKYSLTELTKLFNSTFRTYKSDLAIKNTLYRNNIKRPKPAGISEDTLKAFFLANTNCTADELTRRYNKEFASNLCTASIRIKRRKYVEKVVEEEERTLAFTKYDESLNPHIKELISSNWGLLLSKQPAKKTQLKCLLKIELRRNFNVYR